MIPNNKPIIQLLLGALPILIILIKVILKLYSSRGCYQHVPEQSIDEIALQVEKKESLLKNSLRTRIFLYITSLVIGLVPLCTNIVILVLSSAEFGKWTDLENWNLDFIISSCGILFWMICLVLLLSSFRAVFLSTDLGHDSLLVLVDEFSLPARTFKALFSTLLLAWIPILVQFFHRIYFTASAPKSVDEKLLLFQPIFTFCLLLSCKMLMNETRFLKRLLLNDNSSKELKSSWYSQMTFSYVDDLMAVGADHPLEQEDLDALIQQDKSRVILKNFDSIKSNNRSLAHNLYVLVRKEFLWQQFATFVSTSTSLAGPLLLKLTLDYIADNSLVSHPIVPYLYGLALFIATMIRSLADGQTYFLGRRVGLRIRATLISLIYSKSLKRLSNVSPEFAVAGAKEMNPGKIANLMSVDATKILEVCCYLMYIWSTPLQALIFIAYLIYIAGLPALAGIACMIFVVPVAAYISSWLQNLRKRLMNATDARIGAVNELLQAIRIVKFFAWEKRFEEKVNMLRENELHLLWSYIFSSAAYRILWTATPVVVSFSTFATMTWLSGANLSISTAFTCLSIFQALQRPVILIPEIVVNVLEAWISYKRIHEYLDTPELADYINVNHENFRPQEGSIVQFIPDSRFRWYISGAPESGPESANSNSNTKDFVLSNIDLIFPKHGLSVIHGPTGSGKSSLMNAILGELNVIAGGIFLGGDRVLQKGQIPVAYASQQVWLQNASIKENILFGCEYNSDRYNRVIIYCALERDLQVLEGGDKTEVGEKGVNLSGGQKARISLARAIYSFADVVLMDDPLSAVDAPTAKHIFENAICGTLMKGRTRILVTHAAQLCLPKADLVVEMKRGKPSLVDSPKVEPLNEHGRSLPLQMLKQESTVSTVVQNAQSNHQLIEAEGRMQGSVELRVYWAYCQAAGGLSFVFLLVLTFCSAQILIIGNDIWIKIWTDAYSKLKEPIMFMGLWLSSQNNNFMAFSLSTSSSIDLFYYIGVYGLIGLSSILVLFFRILVVARASLRASRTLHSSLIFKILRAPIRFFEKTPMGRLVNRFSKDIKDIDMDVAQFSSDFLSNVVKVVSLIGVILIFNPYSLLGFIPVSFFYVFVGKRYLQSTRELKRLDSNTRSPIFSHFGETIQGASIIRAYSVEKRFSETLHERVDLNHQAFSLIWILNRWLGVRIDLVGALLGLTTTIAVVYASQTTFIDAGFAGLSIAYSLGFSDSLIWLVRMHAMMEMEMNAVERVDEYLQIEEEAPSVNPSNRPPEAWPSKGNIKVENLTLRYSPEGPPILSDVSFQVKPGEKIGIVGRTGAGKTTLTLAFFRFTEAESGRIWIDDYDISKLGLYDLRSKLTVIPQDPVLFEGTLRTNLDPFSEYSDDDIWESLRSCHFLESCMIHRQSSVASPNIDHMVADSLDLDFHNINLETAISEGGSNFSQGQRQLLCLARAILKRSKVIVLDEATASVDHDTDVKIQQTIRDRFKGSTLLCIAHRLSTICDYNKILVLDKGRVSQFGTPFDLIQTPGIFKQMCIESNEFAALEKMAFSSTKGGL